MNERPFEIWELIVMAIVLVGWVAIAIRVLRAYLRRRRIERDPINRWQPPPPWRNKR